jgi:sugar/nucleoside kinase (ribokinase family)
VFGIDAAVVTVAPPSAPELDALRGLDSVQLRVIPSDVITSFEHASVGSRRVLTLLARARPIERDDIPLDWRAAEVIYAGPVAGELQPGTLAGLTGFGICGIQGWLRARALGPVSPRRLDGACEVPGCVRAVSFSSADHPAARALPSALTARGIVVAVTRGARGARVSWGGKQSYIAPAPARPVDSTGAGDVFTLVFGLCLRRGLAPEAAAERAALAAARVVEGPGLGTLPQISAGFF